MHNFLDIKRYRRPDNQLSPRHLSDQDIYRQRCLQSSLPPLTCTFRLAIIWGREGTHQARVKPVLQSMEYRQKTQARRELARNANSHFRHHGPSGGGHRRSDIDDIRTRVLITLGSAQRHDVTSLYQSAGAPSGTSTSYSAITRQSYHVARDGAQDQARDHIVPDGVVLRGRRRRVLLLRRGVCARHAGLRRSSLVGGRGQGRQAPERQPQA
jgi:hypothetical protein